MEIILLETLNKLGKAGEIVNVKDGYATNYLIPMKKALFANKKNREDLASKMSIINKNNEIKTEEAKTTQSKIDGQIIKISMEANDEGKLYGNVNQKQIVDAIYNDYSLELNADNLAIGQINVLGEHDIHVRLYDEITAHLKVEIVKKT